MYYSPIIIEPDIQSILKKYTKQIGIRSISIGIVKNGVKHFYHHHSENSPLPGNSPERTSIHIGEITELFSSLTAIKQISLIVSDKINLYTPIVRILPFLRIKEPPFNTRYINIIDLLAHTSGIGDHRDIWENLFQHTTTGFVRNENNFFLKEYYSKSQIQQIFLAKSQRYHSSHNYALIACIIEELTGIPFHQLIKETILDKLNLSRTFIHPNVIQYHKNIHKSDPINLGVELLYSSLNGVSTIEDLLEFLEVLIRSYNGSSLFSDIIEKYFHVSYQPTEEIPHVGLPFLIRTNDLTTLEYNGQYENNQIKISIIPELDLALIVYAENCNQNSMESLYSKILPSLNNQKLKYSSLSNKDANITHKYISGIYRPDSSYFLNTIFYQQFGNVISIENGKGNSLYIRSLYRKQRQQNILINPRRNKLYYLGETQNKFIYGFKVLNNVFRIVFPKSDIPIYCYLETPFPVTLYRLKSRSKVKIQIKLIIKYIIVKVLKEIIFPSLKSLKLGIRKIPYLLFLSILSLGLFVKNKFFRRNKQLPGKQLISRDELEETPQPIIRFKNRFSSFIKSVKIQTVVVWDYFKFSLKNLIKKVILKLTILKNYLRNGMSTIYHKLISLRNYISSKLTIGWNFLKLWSKKIWNKTIFTSKEIKKRVVFYSRIAWRNTIFISKRIWEKIIIFSLLIWKYTREFIDYIHHKLIQFEKILYFSIMKIQFLTKYKYNMFIFRIQTNFPARSKWVQKNFGFANQKLNYLNKRLKSNKKIPLSEIIRPYLNFRNIIVYFRFNIKKVKYTLRRNPNTFFLSLKHVFGILRNKIEVFLTR